MDNKTIIGILVTLSGTAAVEIGYLFIKVHVMEAELEHLKSLIQ